MDASVLLCDWAEELNGKLYVQGAGWSNLVGGQVAQIALAILIEVPWDQANRPHGLKVELLDEDGNFVTVDDQPVLLMDGKIEVGRPAGIPPGTPLNVPLAGRFVLPPTLSAGGYRVQLSIDGTVMRAVPFRIMEGPH